MMVSYCGSQQWDEHIVFPHAYIDVSIKSGILFWGVENDICLKGDDMLLKTFEFFSKEFEWFICYKIMVDIALHKWCNAKVE